METLRMPISRLIEAENVVSTDNAMFPGHKKDEVMVHAAKCALTQKNAMLTGKRSQT